SRRSRRPLLALRPRWTLLSLRSLFPGRTRGSRRACCPRRTRLPCRPLRSWRSCRSRRADGPLRPEVACRPWGSRRTDAVEGVVETVEGRVLLLVRHAVAVAVPARQPCEAGGPRRTRGAGGPGRTRRTRGSRRARRPLCPVLAGRPCRSWRAGGAHGPGRAGWPGLAAGSLRSRRPSLSRLSGLACVARVAGRPRWSLRSRWSRRSLQRAGGDVGADRLHLRAHRAQALGDAALAARDLGADGVDRRRQQRRGLVAGEELVTPQAPLGERLPHAQRRHARGGARRPVVRRHVAEREARVRDRKSVG